MAEMEKNKPLSPGMQGLLRLIPKVDELLSFLTEDGTTPPAQLKAAVRETLSQLRSEILAGKVTSGEDLDPERIQDLIKRCLITRAAPNFRGVINATGVVIHTNLGRSILPEAAMARIARVGSGYSNLEFDLKTGRRGSRYSLVEGLLCDLTGAEAALVVNNNAAAVLLCLDTLARGREVVVSRGQLVEIGGSFRIPDVMTRSGAELVEVGATNRTHLRDYAGAINDNTALLLKVHTSNYRVIGFTSEVPIADLVGLAAEYNLPVMEDLGSGSLLDLSRFGLAREPTVGEIVAAGTDVVTFSGDKLLGGPQAGIILGKRQIVEKIKENPMNRALRIDKFTLAGLEAVLRLYGDDRVAVKEIPTLAMLGLSRKELAARARRLVRRIKKPLAGACEVMTVRAVSRVGGGALPEQDLPTVAVALNPLAQSINELEGRLREGAEPVIGRIERGLFLLDMRTVADDEIARLVEAILTAHGI